MRELNISNFKVANDVALNQDKTLSVDRFKLSEKVIDTPVSVPTEDWFKNDGINSLKKELESWEKELKFLSKEHEWLKNDDWRRDNDGNYAIPYSATHMPDVFAGKTMAEAEAMVKNKRKYIEMVEKAQENIFYTILARSGEGEKGYEKWLEEKENNKPTTKSIIKDSLQREIIAANDNQFEAGLNGIIFDKMKDTTYQEPNDNWTKEELYEFGARFSKNPQVAYEYAANLNNAKALKEKNKAKQKTADFAKKNVGTAALATVGSIPANMLGLVDFLDDYTDIAAGRRVIVEEPTLTPFEWAGTSTGAVGEKLNEYGTLNDDIPIIGGKGWGDLYGIGTSIGQSAATTATGGPLLTAITFFGQGAAGAIDDASERGATIEQSLAYGTLVGAAEMVSEYIGADKLVNIGKKEIKSAFAEVFKQAGAEGIEEMFSSTIENIADDIVMGEKSKFNLLVQEYTQQGLEYQEAVNKAWTQLIEEIAFSGIGGSLSGGIHATPIVITNSITQNNLNKTGKVDTSVVEFAESTPNNTKTVNGNKVNWQSLNEYQQASIIGASNLAQAVGMDVTWVSDNQNSETSQAFRVDGKQLLIDVTASKEKIENSTLNNIIVPLVSQEIAIWAKKKSPKIYHKLESVNNNDIKNEDRDKPNIDQYVFRQDNISRANKQGELINDYYYALNKGDIDYDTQRIFAFVNRLNRLDGRNELLARYNRNNSRFDVAFTNGKQERNNDEIHGDSKKEIAGERFSLRDKSSVQGEHELLKRSDRADFKSDDENTQINNIVNVCEELLQSGEKFKGFLDTVNKGERQLLVNKIRNTLSDIELRINKYAPKDSTSSSEAIVMRSKIAALRNLTKLYKQRFNNVFSAEKGFELQANNTENPKDEIAFSASIDKVDKTIDKYSEEQYNNFGWVRFNDVLSAAEYNALISRYADYKHNKHKYPTTRFGEAAVYSYDYPNILMYVKGSIKSPQITKAVIINSALPIITQGTIQKEILSNERKQLSFPYETVTDVFGQGCLAINKKRDFPSFQKYTGEREGKFGKDDNSVNRAKRNGDSNAGENTRINKADSLNESAFFMSVDKQASEYTNVEDETKPQNNSPKKLTAHEQSVISDVCKRLGRKVVLEDLRNAVYKNQIISPDGYVENNVIHLNVYAVNPIGFVFKHELTHFCKKSNRYNDFANAVRKSNLYKIWITKKSNETDIKIAEHKYKLSLLQKHSDIYDITSPKAQSEIIADFVGDVLFADDGGGMTAITGNLNVKNHNKIIEFVLDFISYIKKKLKGQKHITLQLSALQDKFNRMLSDAGKVAKEDSSVYEQMGKSGKLVTDNKRVHKTISDDEITFSMPQKVQNEIRYDKVAIKLAKSYAKKYKSNVDASSLANKIEAIMLLENGKEITDKKVKTAVYDSDGNFSGELTQKERLLNELAVEIAAEVVAERDEYAQEVIELIEEERLFMDRKQRLKMMHMYDTPTKYYKAVGLNMFYNKKNNIREAAIALKDAWNNWSYFYPELFNQNVAAEDIPVRLAETMEYINSMTVEIDYDALSQKVFADLCKKLNLAENYEKDEQIYAEYRKHFAKRYIETNLKLDDASDDTQDIVGGDIYSNRKNSVKEYSVSQYNKYGWVIDNDILTTEEVQKLLLSFSKDHNRYKSVFGESILYSKDLPGVLMYLKGSASKGIITKVIRINATNPQDASKIKEEILSAEDERNIFAIDLAKRKYGDDVVLEDKAQDHKSYWDYLREITNKKRMPKQSKQKTDSKKGETLPQETEPEVPTKPSNKLACFIKCNDTEKIAAAQTMESEGKDSSYIWRELKIFRSVFGDWVRLIDADGLKFYASGTAKTDGHTKNIKLKKVGNNIEGRLCDFLHWKQLYKEFPHFKDVRVLLTTSFYDYETVRYLPSGNTIVIDKKLCKDFIENKDREIISHLMREIQRMIQVEEGKYIGKSRDYWKNMELEGALPFSKILNRHLTAEDMSRYFVDNYEAQMAAKMQSISDLFFQTAQGKASDLSKVLVFEPNVQPELAITFDSHGNIVTVADNDKISGNHYFKNYVPAQKNYVESLYELNEDDVIRAMRQEKNGKDYNAKNLEAFGSEETSIKVKESQQSEKSQLSQEASQEFTKDTVGETQAANINSQDTARKVKNFVASTLKTRALQQAYRQNVDIKAGNSGFVSDKNLDLKNPHFLDSREITISNQDTVGRKLNHNIKNKLGKTIAKNNKGEPISLYLVNRYGDNLLRHEQMGILLSSADMAIEKYEHQKNNGNFVRNGVIEEYYAVINNPLILPFEPYELSVQEIGFYLTEINMLPQEKYFDMIDSYYSANLKPSYNNAIIKNFRKVLRKLGYDSIIYKNQNYDAGSLAVAVLDSEQLILVARNGLRADVEGIVDGDYEQTINLSEKQLGNTKLLKTLLEDKLYIARKHKKKANQLIYCGSSGWFQCLEKNAEKERIRLTNEISSKSNVMYNEFSNSNSRKISEKIKKVFESTVFKNNDGELISFYLYSKKPVNIEDIARQGKELKGFNGAFDDFVQQKTQSNYSYNGAFYEYIANVVNPLVLNLNEWNTLNVAEAIFNDGLISSEFYESIRLHPNVNTPTFSNYASKKLKDKIELLGYDAIVLVKDKGENALIVFDKSQILLLSKNGILVDENLATQSIYDNDGDLLNGEDKTEYVVIDEKSRPVRDIAQIEKEILALQDNSQKLKLLTEHLECPNIPQAENLDEIKVGQSGLLERKSENIWGAKVLLNKQISETAKLKVASVDTAGRTVAHSVTQEFAETVFKDNDGRLLSLFVWNKYGKNRYKHSAFPYNMGSLAFARDNYLLEKSKQPNLKMGAYEEYYANIKNPYFTTNAFEHVTAQSIAEDMYENGILSKSEYRLIVSREGAHWSDRNNNAAKYLCEILSDKGIDAIVYMNRQFDPGSLSVIVLDEENLQLVSNDGSKASLDKLAESKYNIVKVKCVNQKLSGKRHPVSDVLFETKRFQVGNVWYEVVVPQFESVFEVQLPEDMYKVRDKKQFKECYCQLKNNLKNNPDLQELFSEKELQRIYKDLELKDYVWHHDVPPGKMKLVKREIHNKTGHTGGRYIWGGGSKNR